MDENAVAPEVQETVRDLEKDGYVLENDWKGYWTTLDGRRTSTRNHETATAAWRELIYSRTEPKPEVQN